MGPPLQYGARIYRARLSDVAQGRDNNFQLLRFLAAFAVLLCHSFPLSGDDYCPFQSLHYSIGDIAVDVFFVSSGFLVTASLVSRSITSFVAARVLRVFPGLFVANVLTVVVLGAWFSTHSASEFFAKSEPYEFIARNTTLVFKALRFELPGVFADNTYARAVNGSLWTLPREMKLYGVLIGIGLLALVLRRWVTPRRRAWLFAAIALVTLVVWIRPHFVLDVEPRAKDRLAYFFFAGGALYLWREHVRISWIAALIAFVGVIASGQRPTVFLIVYTVALPYLVISAAYLPGGPLRAFQRVGDYSYGLYVYAFPVQQAVAALWPSARWWDLAGMSFVVTLALAMASWHVVEKPALAFSKRFRRTQNSERAVGPDRGAG